MKIKWLLLIVLVVALFLRVYRISDLLGFYYDQGRDALVIWDLWHKHNFFLIGPTTGIEGIFRGPWYYWLIAPLYLIGKGNPVYPSIFLSITVVCALYLMYVAINKLGDRRAALVSVLVGSCSYVLVLASRWLSNPTPMFFISIAFLFCGYLVIEGKKWAWIGTGLLAGMAMQFGSATEIFYFPVIAILAFVQRKNLPSIKVIIASIAVFGLAFAPQILFDFMHQGILRGAIGKFLIQDQSFKLGFGEMLRVRLPFYYDVFMSKIFPVQKDFRLVFFVLATISLVCNLKKFSKKFWFTLLLLVSPLVGMLFFQGNQGNVYDYYFTGYYLIFVCIFVYLLSQFPKISKVILIVFLCAFFYSNLPPMQKYLTQDVNKSQDILLANQRQAIDWVYENRNNQDFNIDVYVPPVIPYAYDYLFLWMGSTKYQIQPKPKMTPLLYTLYEIDPPHPERLTAWLNRQRGIASIQEQKTFGPITVERRMRLPK